MKSYLWNEARNIEDALDGAEEVRVPRTKMHYAGEIRTDRMHVLPGWAACCSGMKAETIQRQGNHTIDRAGVTCAKCLRTLAAHDAHLVKYPKDRP